MSNNEIGNILLTLGRLAPWFVLGSPLNWPGFEG